MPLRAPTLQDYLSAESFVDDFIRELELQDPEGISVLRPIEAPEPAHYVFPSGVIASACFGLTDPGIG